MVREGRAGAVDPAKLRALANLLRSALELAQLVGGDREEVHRLLCAILEPGASESAGPLASDGPGAAILPPHVAAVVREGRA